MTISLYVNLKHAYNVRDKVYETSIVSSLYASAYELKKYSRKTMCYEVLYYYAEKVLKYNGAVKLRCCYSI